MQGVKREIELPGGGYSVPIVAFGDLQEGASGYRADLFDRCEKQIMEEKAYVITMGDIRDNYRPTIMREMAKVFAKDAMARKQFDAESKEQMRHIADRYSKFSDRIITMLEGHHKIDYSDGTTSTQYLCGLLGVPYGGFVSLIQLTLCRGRNHKSGTVVDIFASHGSCKAAGMDRKVVGNWDADIFLYGHSCEVEVKGLPPMFKPSRGALTPSFRRRPRMRASTGGFMEGYVDGERTYVEEANMAPAPLGWVKLGLSTRRHHQGDTDHLQVTGEAYSF
jgi:hypothetical protein